MSRRDLLSNCIIMNAFCISNPLQPVEMEIHFVKKNIWNILLCEILLHLQHNFFQKEIWVLLCAYFCTLPSCFARHFYSDFFVFVHWLLGLSHQAWH